MKAVLDYGVLVDVLKGHFECDRDVELLLVLIDADHETLTKFIETCGSQHDARTPKPTPPPPTDRYLAVTRRVVLRIVLKEIMKEYGVDEDDEDGDNNDDEKEEGEVDDDEEEEEDDEESLNRIFFPTLSPLAPPPAPLEPVIASAYYTDVMQGRGKRPSATCFTMVYREAQPHTELTMRVERDVNARLFPSKDDLTGALLGRDTGTSMDDNIGHIVICDADQIGDIGEKSEWRYRPWEQFMWVKCQLII